MFNVLNCFYKIFFQKTTFKSIYVQVYIFKTLPHSVQPGNPNMYLGTVQADTNAISINLWTHFLSINSRHLVLNSSKTRRREFSPTCAFLAKKNPLNCKSSNIAWASFFIKLKLPHPWPEVILGWKFFPIGGQWIFSTITIFKSVASTDLNV